MRGEKTRRRVEAESLMGARAATHKAKHEPKQARPRQTETHCEVFSYIRGAHPAGPGRAGRGGVGRGGAGRGKRRKIAEGEDFGFGRVKVRRRRHAAQWSVFSGCPRGGEL